MSVQLKILKWARCIAQGQKGQRLYISFASVPTDNTLALNLFTHGDRFPPKYGFHDVTIIHLFSGYESSHLVQGSILSYRFGTKSSEKGFKILVFNVLPPVAGAHSN